MIAVICILVLAAATLTVFHGSLAMFLCCGIGSFCGAWLLWTTCISAVGQLRLTWLLASTLLIGYCFGAFNTEVSALMAGSDPLAYLGVDSGWAAYALVLVMLACITLLFAGYAEKPMIREWHIVEISWRQERFLWLSMAVIVAAYIHGDLSQGGIANNEGKISFLGAITGAIGPILPAVATIGLVQSSGGRRLRFMALTVAFLLAVIPLGRRGLLYAVVICIFAAARLSGRTWNISVGRKALIAGGAVFVVVGSSFFYIAFRMATWGMGQGNHSIVSILETAERTSLTDPREVVANLNSNVKDRTAFLIRYLALLGRGGNLPQPMWGQDALLGLEFATPDRFYRLVGASKDSVRTAGGEEDLANEHFGLPAQDYANSVLTGGIIDFGLAGILIYPLILCVLTRTVLLFADTILNQEGRLIAVLSIAFLFLQTEMQITGYIVGLRNLIILLIGWALVYSIPGLRRQWRETPLFSWHLSRTLPKGSIQEG